MRWMGGSAAGLNQAGDDAVDDDDGEEDDQATTGASFGSNSDQTGGMRRWASV